MKLKVYATILIFVFSITTSKSQSRGEAAAVGAAAAVAVGAAAFQIHQIIEMWELAATEHVLMTRPEAEEFQLKLNSPFANSTKWSDVSNTSILTFNINYSKVKNDPDGEKEILMMFLDDGYMTQYGIDLTYVTWQYLNRDEWSNMLKLYLEAAVGFEVFEDHKAYIHHSLKKPRELNDEYTAMVESTNEKGESIYFGRTTKFVNFKSMRIGKSSLYYLASDGPRDIVDFQRISGDTYIKRKYNDEMQIIYNEKSMGIYLNATNRLVQLSRGVVSDIHGFLYNQRG